MIKTSVELYEQLFKEFYDKCVAICQIIAKYYNKESYENLTTFVIVEDKVVGTCAFDECYVGEFDKNLLWASDEEIKEYAKTNLKKRNMYICIGDGV